MASNIHSTAILDPSAEIGDNCEIGPYTVVGSNTKVGDNSKIGAYCEIGVDSGTLPPSELVIGENSIIRSGSVFYKSSEFGPGLRTGHKVTVREGVEAGVGLQLGTLNDIQGYCSIGNHVRFHSNVHVGHKSKIGDFVWIFPYVVLTNDPHPPSNTLDGCKVGDFSVIATMSTVLPGVVIGKDALIGAQTLVRDDVSDGNIYVGAPGKTIGKTSMINLRETGKPAYPWRRHFHRGYPKEVVANWLNEFPHG